MPPPPAPGAPPPLRGRVVAVAASEDLVGGVGKAPRPEIRLTALGVPGDVHYAPTWLARHPGRTPEDCRPVTVIAVEAVRGACQDLGLEPAPGPGAFGENLLVEGLGDLGDLRAGDRLRVGAQVVLEVTGQNRPCRKLAVLHMGMTAALVGRRGLICGVRAEGTARPGDGVRVERAS